MLSQLVRIGRDAETRYTQNGTAVTSFSAAYDVGFGDSKRTQWIKCAIFGKRGETSAQYLTKGSQIVIHAVDIAVNEYDKKDGSGKGFALECKVVEFDFAGGNQQQCQQPNNYQQQPQQQPQQRQPQQQQAQQSGGYTGNPNAPQTTQGYQEQMQQQNTHQQPQQGGGFDDDIPF